MQSDVKMKDPQALDEEKIQEAGKTIGVTYCVMAVLVAVLNLGFIIPSLIYAYNYTGDICLTMIPEGFSFNLSTWLQVDAYMRIAFVALIFLVAIITCISLEAGLGCSICLVCFMILYSLFALAWNITGSVLFWGKLKPLGYCTGGGVHDYMFAILIISYVSSCLYCLGGFKNKNAQPELPRE